MSREARNLLPILLVGALMLLEPARAEAYRLVRSVFGNGVASMGGAGLLVRGTLGQGYFPGSQGVACNDSICIRSGFWGAPGPATTALQDGLQMSLPARVEFGSPHPLPSSGLVSLPVALPRRAAVELAVYDVQGRRLWAIHAGTLPAGYHSLHWNGRGAGGQEVPGGVYFVRLVIDGQPAGERRIVRIR